MKNKQVEFNPNIYTLSKLYRFDYEISLFKYTTGLVGKMDVKIFLMFIVAENTGSVNICIWDHIVIVKVPFKI